ncbi:hypothetical protein HMSSN036_44560 [Paenibacillus macerans]|nr:hypothetical protein HMSSN036_44560 [Paenibacillus macerans]
MGVMNRFMNFLGLQEEEEIVEREKFPAQEEEIETPSFEPRKNQRGSNVVSIHSQKNVKVILYEPRSYDEAQEIADHLRSHRSVVVNLQRVRNDQALRIIDFLSGTITRSAEASPNRQQYFPVHAGYGRDSRIHYGNAGRGFRLQQNEVMTAW